MFTMEINTLLLVVSGTVALLIILGIFRWVTGTAARTWNQHKIETIDKWEAEGVEFIKGPTGSKFGGLESTGYFRVIRGIGLTVLTPTDLRVTRSAPTDAWCIPFDKINAVTIQSAYLGQPSKKSPFIVIDFDTEAGESDTLGFQIPNHNEWAEEIAKAAGVELQHPATP
jgi:hypothetical protein